MKRKTIEDIQVAGKRVLVRVDFNVPLDGRQRITDETRITAALGTLKELLARGASLVLMSHLGRPDGKVAPAMSLKPVAERLAQHLGRPVDLAPDCVGQEVERLAAGLQPGQVLMLENLRFHPEEEANDPEFARRFAALGEVYVNDAFGTAHRAHASTEGVAHHLAVVASGRLMEQEVRYLKDVLQQPRRPLVAILGGAKVSGKIELIKHLLTKVDSLLIGGGMAYTFFKALGLEIGNSLLDAKQVETARQTLEQAKTRGVEFLLPVDCAVADRFATDAQTQVVDREQIPLVGRAWTSARGPAGSLPSGWAPPAPRSGTAPWGCARWIPLSRAPAKWPRPWRGPPPSAGPSASSAGGTRPGPSPNWACPPR